MMLNFRGVEMHSIYMFILFFFFNQQTEYEMRISDWSSDVCSSDLLDLVHADRLDRTVEHDLALDDLVAVGLKRLDDVAYRDRAEELAGDRKSAVEGKSVSERVALGGRRIIKKQKKVGIVYNQDKLLLIEYCDNTKV